MAIRYIKDDGHYFYIVTEKGQVAFRVKDHARLLNTTDKTWTIERYGWAYTYDENNNLIEQRHACLGFAETARRVPVSAKVKQKQQ